MKNIKKLKIPVSTKTLKIPTSIKKNLFSLIQLNPIVVIRGPIPKRISFKVSNSKKPRYEDKKASVK